MNEKKPTLVNMSVEDALTVLRWRCELTDKAVGREYDLIGAIVEKAREMMRLCSDLLGEIQHNGVSIDNPYLAENKPYMDRIETAETEAVASIILRLSAMDR